MENQEQLFGGLAKPVEASSDFSGLAKPVSAPEATGDLFGGLAKPVGGPSGSPQSNYTIDDALRDEGASPEEIAYVKSIYSQETGAGKNVQTSVKGARGHMQVMPDTFKGALKPGEEQWSVDNPEHNLRIGTRYALQMRRQGGNDDRMGAIGYYSGPGGQQAAREGKIRTVPGHPDHPTSFQYGDKVAQRAAEIRGQSPKPADPLLDPERFKPNTQTKIAQKTPEAKPERTWTQAIKEEVGQFVDEFKNDPKKAFTNTLKGVKHGIYNDNVLGVQQLAGRAASVTADALGSDSIEARADRGTAKVDAEVTKTEREYQKETGDSNAAGVGRVIGNVLTPLGVLTNAKKAYTVGQAAWNGAKAGAVGGAVQSVDTSKGDYAGQKGTQVIVGTAGGGVIGGGARAAVQGAAKAGFQPAENYLVKEAMQKNFSGKNAAIDAEIVRDLAATKAAEGGRKLQASDANNLATSYLETMKIQMKGAGLNDIEVREVLANYRTPHLIPAEVKIKMNTTPEGTAIMDNIAKARRVHQLTPAEEASSGFMSRLARTGIAAGGADVLMSVAAGMPLPLATVTRKGLQKLAGGRTYRWEKAEEAVEGRNVKAAERYLAENGPSRASEGMDVLRQAVSGRNARIAEETRRRAEEAVANRERKAQVKQQAKEAREAKKDEARVESARKEIESVIARETKRRADEAKLKAKEAADREETARKRKDLSKTDLSKTIEKARTDTENQAQDALTTQVNGGVPDLTANLQRRNPQVDDGSPIGRLVAKAREDRDKAAADAITAQNPTLQEPVRRLDDDSPIGQLLSRQNLPVSPVADARVPKASELPRQPQPAEDIKPLTKAEQEETARVLKQMEGEATSSYIKQLMRKKASKKPKKAPTGSPKAQAVPTPQVEVKSLSGGPVEAPVGRTEASKAPAVAPPPQSPIAEALKAKVEAAPPIPAETPKKRGRPPLSEKERQAREDARKAKEAERAQDVSPSDRGGARAQFAKDYDFDEQTLDRLADEYFDKLGKENVREGFKSGQKIGSTFYVGLQKHLDQAYARMNGTEAVKRDQYGRIIKSEKLYEEGKQRRDNEYIQASMNINNMLDIPLQARKDALNAIRQLKDGPGTKADSLPERQRKVSEVLMTYPEYRDRLENLLQPLVDFKNLPKKPK